MARPPKVLSPTASVALVVLTAVMVGCGPAPPTGSPSAVPTASGPASPSVGASASASPSSAVPSATASPSGPADSGPPLPAGVIVDPGLLEVLPARVDGVALQPDPVAADEISRDPLLAESALALAVALAVAPASVGEDLAVSNVIRLRPGVVDEAFHEAFYPEWRDAYNEAACEVSGGVESESDTEIAGRQTFVGRCAGGAMTYHTYLVDQGFLVSITATGGRRFGELILAEVEG
jgi:hypothetical protein